MGMYTELVLKAEIKKDLPENVEAVLQYMFNKGELPTVLPNHQFFDRPRWTMIGQCSSYYHIPWSASRYEEHYIFSRSDLKNYDDEIRLFLDWITPYLDNFPGDCIGWYWYEEDPEPTLIRMPGENKS